MRAVVLTGVNRLELRDVPSPPPDAHEVRLRVAAVGLCGTDLHIVAGHANYNRDANGRVIPFAEEPQILGHEIAGVVEDIGRDVANLHAGDRVIIDQEETASASIAHRSASSARRATRTSASGTENTGSPDSRVGSPST